MRIARKSCAGRAPLEPPRHAVDRPRGTGGRMHFEGCHSRGATRVSLNPRPDSAAGAAAGRSGQPTSTTPWWRNGMPWLWSACSTAAVQRRNARTRRNQVAILVPNVASAAAPPYPNLQCISQASCSVHAFQLQEIRMHSITCYASVPAIRCH